MVRFGETSAMTSGVSNQTFSPEPPGRDRMALMLLWAAGHPLMLPGPNETRVQAQDLPVGREAVRATLPIWLLARVPVPRSPPLSLRLQRVSPVTGEASA